MTERRGSRGGEPPGRGDPRRGAARSGSSRRPGATEGGRAGAKRPVRGDSEPRRGSKAKNAAEPGKRPKAAAAGRRAQSRTAQTSSRTAQASSQTRKRRPQSAKPQNRRPQARRPPKPKRPPKARRPPRTLRLGRPTVRLRVTFGVMAFVLSLFAGRLIMLQGVDPDSYKLAASKENAKAFTLHASRGAILDRNGVPLSVSEDAVQITADPSQTSKDAPQLAAILAGKLPSTSYDELLEALTKPDSKYQTLARRVSPKVWNEIRTELKDKKLGGIYTDEDPVRSHPNGTIAANVIGFVDAEGKGGAGLEYGLNSELSGEDGQAIYQVDRNGNRIPLANHTMQEPKPGVSAQLTLDRDLQWFAEKRIEQAVKQYKAEAGVVITMDVQSGELLAMANYPTYDPDQPGKVPNEAWGNRALEQVYEPGSVQKVVTMAALADAGLISLDTKLTVPGSYLVADRRIKDHWSHGTVRLTMAGVVAKSSNVGTIMAAQQMPKPQFVDYLRKFGFGQQTGIDFPGESKGLMPPGDEWSELTRSNVAFGQGMSVNAVQMAAAVNAVANGGTYMPPKLVKDFVDANGEATPAQSAEPRRVVSAEAAKEVTTMMEAVTGEGGTAALARIPGYRVAGKTGTAQQVDPKCPTCGYSKWATSFAGFAPADNPRFMTYVVLQNPTNGRSGGAQGGPVFRDVTSYALQKYAVPPTGANSPNVPLTW
jgi:cell division protein FtsI (penicillin-binding protein 3)